MRDGRDHDLQHLEEQLRNARTPRERQEIQEAGAAIARERTNGKIASMRESLIRAKRSGNAANVKDIEEYIKGKPQYNND